MTDEHLTALIQAHLARYSEFHIADAYKLLHQATFGPGHLIDNRRAAHEWLEQECSLQTPSSAEALVESIHPEHAMVRVHLRPFLACQGTLRAMLDAMVRSAQEVQGDAGLMDCRWHHLESLCEPGSPLQGRFDRHELRLFGEVRAQEHWPAVHHSPAYVRAYRPVYRVLARFEAEALCARLNVPFVAV